MKRPTLADIEVLPIRAYRVLSRPFYVALHKMGINLCRFQPSCSQYAEDAIRKYGLLKGSAMGAWRIVRCNPWSRRGYDPVK